MNEGVWNHVKLWICKYIKYKKIVELKTHAIQHKTFYSIRQNVITDPSFNL